jgi:hypothetical protein
VTSRGRLQGLVSTLAAVMLAAGLAGCSGDAEAPDTTAPDGFQVVRDAKGGFAVAVPQDWTRVPLSDSPATFDKTANSLRLANPKLASVLNQARVLGQSGGRFMAVAPDGTSNANLTVDKAKEKTVDEIAQRSTAGLQNFGATNISQEPTTLDGKAALKVSFRLPVETDNGTVPTDEVQWYLLEGKKAFILTVAAVPTPVANSIANSLKLR